MNVELIRADRRTDGQTDGRDEGNRLPFFATCERAANDLKYMDYKLNNETTNVRKIFKLRNADPD